MWVWCACMRAHGCAHACACGAVGGAVWLVWLVGGVVGGSAVVVALWGCVGSAVAVGRGLWNGSKWGSFGRISGTNKARTKIPT